MQTGKRIAVPILFFLGMAMGAAVARADGFDDVFPIMTQDGGDTSPGCRGCHMGTGAPCARFRWGETQDEVLSCLQTLGYVDGGSLSRLADRLDPAVGTGDMPQGGRPWNNDELQFLRAWLGYTVP